MKNLRNFFLVIIATALIASSCNKDEYSAKDARKVLQQASAELEGYVTDFKQSEGMKSVNNTGNLAKRSSYEKANQAGNILKVAALNLVKPLAAKVGIATKKSDINGYYLLSKFGTYQWNFAKNDWDYTAEPADKMIVKFPATESDLTNNAVFTIHKLTMARIETEYGDVMEPITAIHADFVVSGIKQLELKFNEEFNNNRELVNGAVELFFNPYQLNAIYGTTQTSIFENFSLKKGAESLISSEANVVFGSEGEIPEFVTGFFQAASIKIELEMNIKAINDQLIAGNDADFVNAINKHTNANLYSFPDEKKIGELELAEQDEQINVLIKLGNGTKEDMKPYFENIAKLIDQIGNEFANNNAFARFPLYF